MISVNTNFVNTAKALAHTPCAKLVCTDGQTTKTFTKNEFQSFSVERSACVSGTFTLGSTVAGVFTATLLTSALRGAGFATLANLKVTAYMGYVVNGSEVYLQEGIFYLDDSETTDKGLFTEVKGYDLFMSPVMDEPINTTFLEGFSSTLTPQQAFAALAAAYPAYSFSYSNIDSTGTTPVFVDETMTIRDVLSRLAISAGCNLIVSPTEVITCVFPATEPANMSSVPASRTFGTRDFKSCEIDARDKTYITYLECDVQSDSGSVKAQYPDASVISALAPYSVGLSYDNSYFTDSSVLATVYQRFMPYVYTGQSYRNLHYQGHNLDLRGFPYLEPFDGCAVTRRRTDGTNETFFLVPFTVKHTYNGAIVTNLSATTIQQTQNTQSSASTRSSMATQAVAASITDLRSQTQAIYAVCPTAASSAAKVADIANFNLFAGVAVTVLFENINAVDNPTLNISGTGAFPIYANNLALTNPSPYQWRAGQVVSLVFAPANGNLPNRWAMVDANPANFCDFVWVDENDHTKGRVLRVSADADATSFHTDIGADSIRLKHGADTQLGITSDTITIGADPTRQMVMNSSGVNITNGDARLSMQSQSLTLETTGSAASKTVITSSEMNTPIVNHQQALFTNENDATGYTYVIEHRSNGHLTFKGFQSS